MIVKVDEWPVNIYNGLINTVLMKISGGIFVKSFNVHEMTKMALCLAFCVVAGYISFPLPFTPGLVTALTVALAVTALVLSPKLTFITIAAYVFLGAVGLPIFPGFVGGMGRILSPTGGFYLGWPIVYCAVSYFKGNVVNFRRYALVAILIGVPFTYVGGIISMMLVMNIDVYKALAMAVLPFVLGDVLKAVLAVFIAVRINKYL